MSLVSGDIPNFINGVSQQPPALRLASQCEEQINGLPTAAEGLVKRPPTVHIAGLAGAPATNHYMHIIERDQTEKYVVVASAGALRVYDLVGNQRTVNAPDGWGYLSGIDLRMLTVADYTFVVNRAVQVLLNPEPVPVQTMRALVYIRQAGYAFAYNIWLNGTHFAHSTSETDGANVNTEAIAAALRTQMAATGWVVQQSGSTLLIQDPGGVNFDFAVSDSYGDQAIIGFTNTLQDFTDLPAKAFDGYQVEITGTPNNAFDNLYVRYKATSASAGVWEEMPQPGRLTTFNAATMPHLLVREEDGTFTFKRATWAVCEAGNETTCPRPSFCNQLISDVFFYRNRLGFTSGEQVVLSRSADLFNFWRATATDLLDTDPIDLGANHSKVSILRHAVPFNEALVLFGDEVQFTFGAADILTPKTATVLQSTEFPASSTVRPVGCGSFLYFCAPRGTTTAVQEYYVDGSSKDKDADDVTAHVPHYVAADCRKLLASPLNNMLIALTDGAPDKLFLYNFYVQNRQKAQSAWSTWTFPGCDRIVDAVFSGNSVIVVMRRGSTLYLERIDLDLSLTSGTLPYVVMLDRRLSESAVGCTYDAAGGTSTLSLPYTGTDDLVVVVAGGSSATLPAGYVPAITARGSSTLTVKGDLRTLPVRVGKPYEFRYTFSPLMARKQVLGGGMVADTAGRLQIHRLTVTYGDTGYFQVVVTPFRRDPYTYTFTGRVVGSAKTLLGSSGIESGTFRVPVMAHNTGVKIELVNDKHLPCRFLTARWEGQRVSRSRSVD